MFLKFQFSIQMLEFFFKNSKMEIPLFGGAITIHRLPSRFKDLSEYRQIPDHQEVYSDPVSDQSIIIEINQYVQDENPRIFWDDLADANECKPQDSNLVQIEQFENCYYLHGTQKISKSHQDESFLNTVDIKILVIRLEKVSSDICIYFNSPIRLSNSSIEIGTILAPVIEKDFVLEIQKSFKIMDWSLFG